jgi:hypothetical protein
VMAAQMDGIDPAMLQMQPPYDAAKTIALLSITQGPRNVVTTPCHLPDDWRGFRG